jgi:rhomboid protease GluP
MEFRKVLRENWLTKLPRAEGTNSTWLLVMALVLGSYLYWAGPLPLAENMSASGEAVFQRGEHWRLWSALFAHADFSHLMSNLVLFVPFAYFLTRYFGKTFFPLVGFALGGIINFAVLKTMPLNVHLIGVSGVVYWMGAAWITLSFLIDRRDSLVRRWIKSLAVSAILFIPETYKPEVSHLAHLMGFGSGVGSALIYFQWNKAKIRAEEATYVFIEEDPFWDDVDWEKKGPAPEMEILAETDCERANCPESA